MTKSILLYSFVFTNLMSLACSSDDDKDPSTDTSMTDTDNNTSNPTDTSTGTSTDTTTETSGEWSFGDDTVSVSFTETGGRRTYTMESTHSQRDNGPSSRILSELAGDPLLRSGNLLTDALFAMAVQEARENSVSQIADSTFTEPQDCECFQTGELWNWVWTRDISYATELGLAWLDTERAKQSLQFKLSTNKFGEGLYIVQDTGTGGSWPVSTDRVTWARGAMAVLKHSDDEDFRTQVIEALRNTAEQDRAFVYDPTDGLYTGESSFLDWREQSYPDWTAQTPVHIAMSKSLSTNLNHLYLLRSLEDLTSEEHGASALAAAIDEHFWTGTFYSSYKTTYLDPSPVHRQDLLATALAVLDLGTHPEALAQYPHSTVGAPVIFPQQQNTPIYHNRAIWPFVSSYALLAARQANNGAVFDANLDSLIRGAALNLSHMENFEWQTGANWYEDGDASGPIVNSRRQLWSVAGFLGAVVHGVFGVEKSAGQWQANPIQPSSWFASSATLTIDGQSFAMDGTQLSAGSITYADESDWQQLYGAATPSLTVSGSGDQAELSFSSLEEASFDVYRNGELVAENATSPWTDASPNTNCYTVVARLVHASQPSEPACWWGDNYQRIQSYGIDQFTVLGGQYTTNHGRPHYEFWGGPEDHMQVSITADYTGEHAIQVVYGNGSNTIDSGITAAVKWISVIDSNGQEIASNNLVMPQLGAWDIWGDSSFVSVTLTAGESYDIVITDGWNMSYLEHFRPYTQAGGGEQPYNFVNITELKLLFMR